MKKRFLILILIIILTLSATLLCCGRNMSEAGTGAGGDREPSVVDPGETEDPGETDDPGETEDPGKTDETDPGSTGNKITSASLNISYDTEKTQAMQKKSGGFTKTVSLKVGDKVVVKDNKGNELAYKDGFDGLIRVNGSYKFELKTSGAGSEVSVTAPSDPDIPSGGVSGSNVTVHYANSGKWGSVYAYLWKEGAVGSEKTEWPGDKLTSIGTDSDGNKLYSVTVNPSNYDRIIFNNNNGAQTKNLVVSKAASGYKGEDGTFTYDTDNYGNVRYVTFTDDVNLSYISTHKKKVSIYTPPDYCSGKKYGVMYMFDSQNLYSKASGAQKAGNPWAADVAITNTVRNGRDGKIIVAIDNTDGYRDKELTMSSAFVSGNNNLYDPKVANEAAFYDGKLEKLGAFMIKTLMPWVNAHYSVEGSAAKTGIAGSSSGGLAAYYVGLEYNDKFGYIGAFSPANGIFKETAWNSFYSKKDFSTGKPKIYVYCGYNDKDLEDLLLPATQKIKNIKNYGYSSSYITEYYHERATHNETYWRLAFMDFLGKTAL